MKELSIEEKAQRFDEALIRCSRLWESDMITRENYEYIFPELAESEDARIRKAIYNCVKWFGFDSCFFKDVSQEECLAWLEAQGEQKTVDEIAKEVCKNRASATTFLKSAGIMNEKGELAEQYRQGEQNPEEADNLHNYLYGEREATWSEEDNINCKRLLYFLDGGHLMHDHNIELHIWLKSIKDRVQLQSKQEWGEEDEKMCNDTINFIETGWTDNGKSHLIPWLKSLKERYTWKPSDGQLECLRYAINKAEKD